MFEPGTVTYGFAKNINNPKYKYAISKRTPTEHKPYLKKVLEEAYGSN